VRVKGNERRGVECISSKHICQTHAERRLLPLYFPCARARKPPGQHGSPPPHQQAVFNERILHHFGVPSERIADAHLAWVHWDDDGNPTMRARQPQRPQGHKRELISVISSEGALGCIRQVL